MKNVNQILSDLYKLPEEFKQHVEAGEWRRACNCYRMAVWVSEFIQMDQEAREKLKDQFPEEQVDRAYREAGLC